MQLKILWLDDIHVRPAFFWVEIEEEWIRQGIEGRWWRDWKENTGVAKQTNKIKQSLFFSLWNIIIIIKIVWIILILEKMEECWKVVSFRHNLIYRNNDYMLKINTDKILLWSGKGSLESQLLNTEK